MRVMVVMVIGQKVWVDVELGVEVEAAQVKHFAQGHFTKVHHFLRGTWVHVL
ncbi:MAG: hypothetical protein RL295_554, partial [Pseudomonadota bacterium]